MGEAEAGAGLELGEPPSFRLTSVGLVFMVWVVVAVGQEARQVVFFLREDLICCRVAKFHSGARMELPLMPDELGSLRILLRTEHARLHPIKVLEHLAVVIACAVGVRVPRTGRVAARDAAEAAASGLVHGPC